MWVVDRRTGDRVRRAQPRYDVRWRVDGRLYKYTFEQRGWADEFARRLVEDFARGCHFDADARHFIDPTTTTDDDSEEDEAGVSFYDLVIDIDYTARKWRGWAPASRRNAVRELARACLFLVDPDAPDLSLADYAAADAGVAVVPAVLFDVRSDLLVAAATLAAAGVFQPLRRRVQASVDSRFNRTRYDAVRTIDAFVSGLRDRTDIGALAGDLTEVVHRTVQPAHVTVWLRAGGSR